MKFFYVMNLFDYCLGLPILSSLPQFSYDKQEEFKRLAKDSSITNEAFNKKVARLLREIRSEKPAFQSEIDRDDLLNSFIVYALKNNSRIVKQDGAFILCGLLDGYNSLSKFRHREKGGTAILLVDKRKKMLDELDRFSINHAMLFPEIECVSEYIKSKYS